MTSMKERLNEVGDLTHRLQKEFPNETAGFLNFTKEAEGGVAMSLKEKELINTALSAAAAFAWCVAFHVRNAIRAGATRNEITEAGIKAIMMQGGPAFM